ncbi:MAG TPA: ABC transporter ATP-binding protein [Planctomycetaceae bacterium]|jgi:ABC-2 type transport system ATP-binding protein|nr:ABC transporter ATP-binding protein [Planctomycetaceae bacterium]
MASESVIQIRNLTKIYRDFWGRPKVRALNSLSLDVQPGEVFGLLGPNGSGKTTTMKLLLGLLFPSEGEIKILGRSAADVEKNERIGYLPEESYLYRFLNAEETLDFYGRLFKMSAATRRQRSDSLIKMVGLDAARRRQLKEYSKGMTRRIGLAQALINDPDLVLLDEPTSGLDPIGTREMKDLILRLKQQGKTVVMCSHQLADVQDVCDRIAILYGGELKLLGKVDELLTEQNETQLLTSPLSEGALKEIEQVIVRHGGQMHKVDHPVVTLEELFLKIVKQSQERPGQRFTPDGAAGARPGDGAKPVAAREPAAAGEQVPH